GLCRAVDDELDRAPVLAEDREDLLLVPDVEGQGMEAFVRLAEVLPVPVDRAVVPEEVTAHVVVDSDDVEALLVQELHRFASDEPGRAGDDGYWHRIPRRFS